MKFTTKATVTGAKMFKDSIDGQSFDQTTLFVQVGMDESKGTAKGFATQSFQWGTSDEYHKIKHLPFPFDAEIEMELVTTGKQQKQRIVGLKPLAMVKQGQGAA